MTKARDIMTEGTEHLSADDTVADAAQRLATADVGAMPVCDENGKLQGMVTDRDLVVKVLAQGKDPQSTTLAEIADQPEVVTIGADDSLEEAIKTMTSHKVRRLPVIDGDQLVGMVSQADLAVNCPAEQVGDLVEAISAAP
ncbi:MAG TPA: CBS domain-containing protein [Aquihabitans sp.]|jgi:CBS domain-containing protein|nr:CBS domain-containing protein [Aquihabitans sp.]